jgi:hypothetical protein
MLRFIKNHYPYFPIVGLGLYLIVFSVSAKAYPGGSINAPNQQGYSFYNNFLCDVMDPVTKGGGQNYARPLAIIAHLILSFTMIWFFFILPEIFIKQNRNTLLTRYIGMLTMSVFVFMFTSYHDLIVTLTGILGTLALIPFFLELHNYPNSLLKQLAYLCFGLSVLVFFIFETKIGFSYLPFLQKIVFMVDALWVIWVSLIVACKNQVAGKTSVIL